MKWYLESLNKDEVVFKYTNFIENDIKKDIFNYLKNNKEDQLWFYKESTNKKTVGDDFITVFLFKNGKILKEIYRHNRTFYKEVSKPIIL